MQMCCRSHLARANIHQAGATASSALGHVVAGVPTYTWFFCGMIVLSRVAFWVYDMVDAQVFQTVSASFSQHAFSVHLWVSSSPAGDIMPFVMHGFVTQS